MTDFTYRAKMVVNAVQWNQDNLDEMIELLKDVVEFDGTDYYVYADYVEPYFYSDSINNNGYYMLKIGHDEFDPGMWVVLYDDGELEGMSDQQFHRMFEKV